jgi:hypothetical protein
LIGGPTKDFALDLIDLKSKNSLARLKFDAADIYGDVVALEGADGNLSLLNLATRNLIASLSLQSSSLSLDTRVTVSSDFQWLAASTNTRGAIWNLSTNTRSYSLREFRGGWFAEGPSFYADFPKFGGQERSIVKIDLSKGTSPAVSAAYAIGKLEAQQFGRYLLVTTPQTKTGGDKNWSFELRDYCRNTTVWTRKFERESPIGRWNTDTDQALFQWSVWQSAAKEELKKPPNLKSIGEDSDYLFEVVALKTDLILHKLLVKTNKGSFLIVDSSFDGDWLAVTTNHQEVITYSLGSGEEVGHVFGYSPIVSGAANLLIVAISETVLNVYDLSTTEFRSRLKFAAPVASWALSADGKRLFALTTDQTAYVLDLSKPVTAFDNVHFTGPTPHDVTNPGSADRCAAGRKSDLP